MITVRDVMDRLDLKVVAGERHLGRQVTGGYVGDLLSCVMASATSGDLWITVQGHPNVVAVATLVGISAVVVTQGSRVEPATLSKADEEGIPLLVATSPSFEVVAALTKLGVGDGKC